MLPPYMRQQLKQLSGDTAIYGLSTIVQRFLSFLLTPFYTHVLTRSELGIQATIYVMISFVMIFANAGMESAYFRFESSAEGEEEKRRVYWSAVAVNIIAALLIGGGMILFPEVVNRVAFLDLEVGQMDLLRMAGAIVLFDAMAAVSLAAIRMARRAKLFGGIKIGAIVVNVGLNIWFVAVLQMGLTGVFLAGIIQSLVQLLLVLPSVRRMLPMRFDRAMVDRLLRFGLPTIASGLALIALQGIDRPIMKNLTDESTVGLYQAGYRLGIPMMIFVSMFEFAWRPFFLQQASKENARELYARIFTYFNLAAVLLFLSLSFFTFDLATMSIPFTNGRTIIAPNFWDGLVVVPIVLAAYLFSGWYTNFIVGIYIEKRTRALPWITGIGAGVEAALCFLLIPTIGILGGAWGTLAAYLVMAGVLYRYVQRHYRINYEWGRIARIAIAGIIPFVVNLLVLDYRDTSLKAVVIRLGLLAAFPLLLAATRFFHPGERVEAARLWQKLKKNRTSS